MKTSVKNFYKSAISVLILTGMMGMVSCSGKVEGMSESVLTIKKDGTVQANIIENFEKGYYSEEELKQDILQKTVSYNRNTGSGKITVEKVEAGEDKITVQMTYAGIEDYAAFNRAVFFIGTAREAEEAGYDLNVVLSGVKDAQETIGKSDILALGGDKLLLTNIKDGISLNGKALYISENVIVAPNAGTIWYTGDDDGLAYIVYK